ncbi:ectonucleoside triphosphate diphosphohydrolase 5-like [Physella acuta]|uniref:ectonucleoside triphosphate diphosphohydrolase 5-like n=1 Tax=Physella acuta TaxID=109671 RepID=UPI0027DCA53F|nr:ectonucleoside triphosphate diphosphohydrolase 5-like [Physella acuta]
MDERNIETINNRPESGDACVNFINSKCIILAVLVVALTLFSVTKITGYNQSEQSVEDVYSVVFDAGSTGSRVFVFHFHYLIRGTNKYKVTLEKEVFQSVEPGISSYAHKLFEVSESLEPLLHKAVNSVPDSCKARTPVVFKATAGLRLLSKEKAENILQEVRRLLVQSPFHFPDPQQVIVMSGEEEGLFGWVSVNFLLDLIWSKQRDTVTTFDLGGGSTQITFEISVKEHLSDYDIEDLFKINFKDFPERFVFTKSYLTYGLKSARLAVLGGTEGQNSNISYEQATQEKILLQTPCLGVDQSFLFSHADLHYLVRGSNPDPNVLSQCQEKVIQFVRAGALVQSQEVNKREIHLFSYFFDVARWSKLIPWNVDSQVLLVEDFLSAAEKYCHRDRMSSKYPFLCIDLLYIHKLLSTGVGLPGNKELYVEKKIHGREVSWCLGAALSQDFFTVSSLAQRQV